MTKQEFLQGKPFVYGSGGPSYVFAQSNGGGVAVGWLLESDGTYYCTVEFVTKGGARVYRHLFAKKCVFVLKFADCVLIDQQPAKSLAAN